MSVSAQNLDMLVDLEDRHEDLLQRLDDLDRRVATVLKQFQAKADAPLDRR